MGQNLTFKRKFKKIEFKVSDRKRCHIRTKIVREKRGPHWFLCPRHTCPQNEIPILPNLKIFKKSKLTYQIEKDTVSVLKLYEKNEDHIVSCVRVTPAPKMWY